MRLKTASDAWHPTSGARRERWLAGGGRAGWFGAVLQTGAQPLLDIVLFRGSVAAFRSFRAFENHGCQFQGRCPWLSDFAPVGADGLTPGLKIARLPFSPPKERSRVIGAHRTGSLLREVDTGGRATSGTLQRLDCKTYVRGPNCKRSGPFDDPRRSPHPGLSRTGLNGETKWHPLLSASCMDDICRWAQTSNEGDTSSSL